MRTLAGAIVLALVAGAAHAAQVTLSSAWMRPGAAGSDARGYIDIATDAPVTLLAVRSPMARRVQVMRVARTDGVDPGKPAKSVSVVPGTPTRLAFKGDYLLLSGLREDAVNGRAVPVVLEFRDRAGKRQTARADLQVRGLLAPKAEAGPRVPDPRVPASAPARTAPP